MRVQGWEPKLNLKFTPEDFEPLRSFESAFQRQSDAAALSAAGAAEVRDDVFKARMILEGKPIEDRGSVLS